MNSPSVLGSLVTSSVILTTKSNNKQTNSDLPLSLSAVLSSLTSPSTKTVLLLVLILVVVVVVVVVGTILCDDETLSSPPFKLLCATFV